MDEKLDLRERAPEPPKDAAPPERPRQTPQQAFRSYGIKTLIFSALLLWFGYDGWYNPNIESKGFNKVCAVIWAGCVLFYATMTISAGLAARRRRHPPPPSQP